MSICGFFVEAQSNETVIVVQPSSDFNIEASSKSLVFSCLDWYKFIEIYAETGDCLFKLNLKKEYKHNESQMVFIPFDDWDEGSYIILVRDKKVKHIATLEIDNNGKKCLIIDNQLIK